MNDLLVWALKKARQQTLTLVEDLHEEQMCMQSVPSENHPAWTLGHILLGDIYLLVGRSNPDYFREASKMAEKVLSKDPAKVAALILSGNASAGLQDFRQLGRRHGFS